MARESKNRIGESYETPFGNILTVINYFTEKHKGRFILSCNRCSKDKELFPGGKITTSVDSVNNKRCVCGCNPKYKFDKEQNTTRIERRCKE